MAFVDKTGAEHTGSIVRLNRKTVTIHSRTGEWRVDYALLHKVIDAT